MNKLFNIPEMIVNKSQIVYGSLIAMFAYMGFETTVRLNEEAINPERDIPLALVSSVGTAMILYVLVSWIVLNLVGVKKMSKSGSGIEDAANIIFGSGWGKLFGLIAIISISNTILLGILTNSRMLYGMSDYYPNLSLLRYVNEFTKTPIVSICLVAILSILAVAFKDIEKVAVYSSYLFFGILALVNLSLIVLHLKGDHVKELTTTFTGRINNKFPIIPCIAFASCLGIIGFCATTDTN